jgi:surface-adhesin protein E
MRASYLAAALGVTALLAQPCYATHWQVIGRPNNETLGLAYVDMDSIHEDEQYRIATFLTIYSNPTSNAHGIKLDRIAQETAFDCAKHTFALVSTVSYFEGKKTGSSSPSDDWKTRFKGVYEDVFSQRAFDVTCNAPVVAKPPPAAAADEPATVRLPTMAAPQ